MGGGAGNAAGSGAAQTGLCGLGLLVPQVPLEDEALAFGVAGDPLAGGDRPQVHDFHVPLGRKLFFGLFG